MLRPLGGPRSMCFLGLLLLLAVAATAPPLAAQDRTVSRSDSSDLVNEAEDRQTDFEFFRKSRIQLQPITSEGGCDAQIGRICIWFGGEDGERFPPELPEVERARDDFVQFLGQIDAQINDPWVLGQRVRYLAEGGQLAEAELAAEDCGLEDREWCDALLGYALHLQGDFIGARTAFERSLERMDKDDVKEALTPKYILTPDAADDFKDAEPAERAQMWELFWRLSDPLFMVEGNDRLTDHFARWVEARMLEDSENPQMFWEKDLEETHVRYGRLQGYSRTPPRRSAGGFGGGFPGRRPGSFGGGGLGQDTRTVVGYHDPRSRGYLFPEDYLASPADVPPESWITAPREARTWYAPPYAPEMRALETQVGRFRRGDQMLVVAAYQTADGEMAPADAEVGLYLTDARGAEPVDAGPVDGEDRILPGTAPELVAVRGTEPEGVLTLETDPGQYVSSLELFAAPGERAWRARQGVRQDPLIEGLVAVSDLMILETGADIPDSFDEALPQTRRGVRLQRGETFTLFWELYGLRVQERATITVGFTQGRPGFLERVGDFLGVIEPEEPIEVTFQDPGTDDVQSVFRALQLQLPEIEPGAYTLHLRVQLAGREPVFTSRPIVIE